eukprot:5540443-Lingulodinium_polyedra.AAC.1
MLAAVVSPGVPTEGPIWCCWASRQFARVVVDCVEGAQVVMDTQSEPSAPDYGQRFCVQCPFASRGRQCTKWRH